MTQILLIADNLRIKGLFETLDQDTLQLRTAATLDQADQDIQELSPDFTFVQNRMAGFSGEILLRHLKKALPDGAKIVYLFEDAAELAQARKLTKLCLDLGLDDGALMQAVREVILGTWHPPKAAPVRPSQAPEAETENGAAVAAPRLDVLPAEQPVPTQSGEAATGTVVQEPAAAGGEPQPVPAPAPGNPDLDVLAKAAVPAPAAESAPAAPAKEPEAAPQGEPDQQELASRLAERNRAKAGAASFEEIMRRASHPDDAPALHPFEVEERVTLGNGSAGNGSERQGEPRFIPDSPAPPVSAGGYSSGIPLADAIRQAQKKKSPIWAFVLAIVLLLAVVCIPVFSYLAGKKAAPPESALAPRTAPRPKKHPGQAVPPVPTAAAPAPAVTAVPVAPWPMGSGRIGIYALSALQRLISPAI